MVMGSGGLVSRHGGQEEVSSVGDGVQVPRCTYNHLGEYVDTCSTLRGT